jgi:hypothetical protein
MADTNAKPLGALYYPYIHIHDVNWLKANLIIFPCVKRMLPMEYMPSDYDVYPFTQPFHNHKPLLRPAMLLADRSIEAQEMLASRLERDSKSNSFLRKYGRDGARESVAKSDLGFQIHAQKLSSELKEVLDNKKLPEGKRLAWPPINRELYDVDKGYIEVHPRIGEAVMSTIAIACAQSEGLDIVGDARSGELHRTLLEQDLDSVYDSWLSPNKKLEPPRKLTGAKLMEYILGFKGDLSDLSVEKLHQLTEQREPIDKLIAALKQRAEEIRSMDEGPQMDEAFKDATNDVIKAWKDDRKSFKGFAKTFFGVDSVRIATDFARTVAGKTIEAVEKKGGWFGSMLTGGLVGGGPGLVIGLLAHSGLTYYRIDQREKNSPYRFLTTLEKHGVLFRSEVPVAQHQDASNV